MKRRSDPSRRPVRARVAWNGHARRAILPGISTRFWFALPKLTPTGRTHCAICEGIGLGVVPAPDRRGGLRIVFTLDPATYIGEPGEGATGKHWSSVGYDRFLRVSAHPSPGDQTRLGRDGNYWFEASHPDTYYCEEFRAFYGRLLAVIEPGEEERLWARRHLPVTPETCRLLLVNHDRTAFEFWRNFCEIPQRTVLPSEAKDDAGITSRTVRDRFSALLYAEAVRAQHACEARAPRTGRRRPGAERRRAFAAGLDLGGAAAHEDVERYEVGRRERVPRPHMLWAVMAPLFPDLRAEEYTPPVGHKNPRMDLTIPSMGLVVEVKFVRVGVRFADVVEDVAADASLYRADPKWRTLIPFVWDDSRSSEDHATLVGGLRRLEMVHDAVVVSRPGKMDHPAQGPAPARRKQQRPAAAAPKPARRPRTAPAKSS